MVPACSRPKTALKVSAAALYHPDVVLCDLNMPNMDGHEVIACLTARYPHIPVIVISAQSKMEAVERALRAGARDFLLKPISDFGQVRRSIEQCLSANHGYGQQLELMEHIDFFVNTTRRRPGCWPG